MWAVSLPNPSAVLALAGGFTPRGLANTADQPFLQELAWSLFQLTIRALSELEAGSRIKTKNKGQVLGSRLQGTREPDPQQFADALPVVIYKEQPAAL